MIGIIRHIIFVSSVFPPFLKKSLNNRDKILFTKSIRLIFYIGIYHQNKHLTKQDGVMACITRHNCVTSRVLLTKMLAL